MAWIVFCVVAYLVIVLVIGKSKSPRTIARKRRRALKKRIRRAHKKGQKWIGSLDGG